MISESSSFDMRQAALVVERDGWAESPLVGEFLAFVLRTAAHGRDEETLRYRVGQLARAINGLAPVEHDARCDRDCCMPDCRVAMRKAGSL